MPKGSKTSLEWCGRCWIDGQRSIAEAKVNKFPLCRACLKEIGANHVEVARLYVIWELMPDYDEGPEAENAFREMLGNLIR